MKRICALILACVLMAAYIPVSLASSLQDAWYMHGELKDFIDSNEAMNPIPILLTTTGAKSRNGSFLC